MFEYPQADLTTLMLLEERRLNPVKIFEGGRMWQVAVDELEMETFISPNEFTFEIDKKIFTVEGGEMIGRVSLTLLSNIQEFDTQKYFENIVKKFPNLVNMVDSLHFEGKLAMPNVIYLSTSSGDYYNYQKHSLVNRLGFKELNPSQTAELKGEIYKEGQGKFQTFVSGLFSHIGIHPRVYLINDWERMRAFVGDRIR